MAGFSVTPRTPRDFFGNYARLVWLVLVLVSLVGIDRIGGFTRADNALAEARMALSSRQASGDIVFLAIDNRSLAAKGVWPWPREIHADIAERLMDLGAAEIFFDIDFSAASSPGSDQAFAETLAELGGATLLAAFRQAEGVGSGAAPTAENLPLAMFRDHAWLASVNVSPDPDGRIRRYPFGQRIGGEEVPSIASMLAGRFAATGGEFVVNFSIDPASIPAHSAIDLLEGRVAVEDISGRSVVVGAHAAELRDHFLVPVHRVLPGPLLHIVAAETLAQGIALQSLGSGWLLLAVTALVIGIGCSRLRHRVPILLGACGIAALTIEATAAYLQVRHALVLPTAALHAMIGGAVLVLAASELDWRHWLLRVVRLEHRNSKSMLERVITDSSDAIFVVDEECEILEISARARTLFGASTRSGQGTSLSQIVPAEMLAAVRHAIASAQAGCPATSDEMELHVVLRGRVKHVAYSVTPSRLSKLPQRKHVPEKAIIACLTVRDITLACEQRMQLDYLARHDPLTGAMNRSEMLRRMTESFGDLPGPNGCCAIFTVNLHRFKTVNSTLGRRVGDALLKAVVKRLTHVDPRLSAIARLGGDTFALFTEGYVTADDAPVIGERITALLSTPFDLETVSARVGAHVGIAIVGEGSREADLLLGDAEHALDAARRKGGSAIHVFEREESNRQERAREIERALWSALENDEMFLVYQPQVRFPDQSFVGAEALIRWNHPSLGAISPLDFIQIAESSGFIGNLGRWVLERACFDAMTWPAQLKVAVNISPLQLQRGDIIADVEHALANSGLSAERLELEITESVFVAETPGLIETLVSLRAMGISIALDDFGSGFSSFSYLSRLPISKIKLDRMFMNELEINATNRGIIKSVALLATEMDLQMVFEGIETSGQRDFVSALRRAHGQGYFFSRPQSLDDFIDLLHEAAEVQAEFGAMARAS